MGKDRLALVPPADESTGHDRLSFIFAALRQRRLDSAEPLFRLVNGAAPVRPRRIGIDAVIAESLDFRLANLLQLRKPHAVHQARALGHPKMHLRPPRAAPRLSRFRAAPRSRDVDYREDHRPTRGSHCRGVAGTAAHDCPSDWRLRRDGAVEGIGLLRADEDPCFFLAIVTAEGHRRTQADGFVAVLALDDLGVLEGLLQLEDASFEAGPLRP